MNRFSRFGISSLLMLPVSIGLPYLLWNFLNAAIDRNDSVGPGEVFYAPATPTELALALVLLLLALPFAFSFFLSIYPVSLVMSVLDLAFTYKTAVANGTLTTGGNVLVAMLIAAVVQALIYGGVGQDLYTFWRGRMGRDSGANRRTAGTIPSDWRDG